MSRPDAFTRLVGIEHPLVLGAFGGMSSVELTATVSEAGGLGSFGLYGYDADRIHDTARRLRERTDRPFALNVWLSDPRAPDPEVSDEEFAAAADALKPFFDELALDLPARPNRLIPTVQEQVEAVLAERPAVLSVVFGVPSAELLAAAHDAGIAVIGTATTVAEARALDAAGVDAIVASGSEAGGHRVSFLRPAEDSLIGLFSLLPRVVDAVGVPVVAAGGIADARGVRAALALGASAVQVGTAFLATHQSAAAPSYRAALVRGDGDETVLTRAPSGRLARGLPNRLTGEIRDPAPFPLQNWLTGRFRAVAGERDRADLLSLWAGQSTGLSQETDAAELARSLAEGARFRRE